jgi:predicted RNA-binding protein YlqC (UPF0109 family)
LLVDDANAVRVICSESDDLTTLTVHVGNYDVEKIIGRTARSLRTVLLASGKKANRRYDLKIAGGGSAPADWLSYE